MSLPPNLAALSYTGFPIIENWLAPRDKVLIIQQPDTNNPTAVLHPSLMLVLKYGRTPLWTRHTVGSREAERDRRKYGSP